jgi:nucleotide-binding universal stress UspA family protein
VYKHILIATDGSDLSEKAIEHGVALAKALSAKVTAVTVLEPSHVSAFEPGVTAYKEYITTLAAKYLRVAKDAATASGVTCDVVQIEHEQPYQAIVDTAEKRGCDVIVMASTRLPRPSAHVLARWPHGRTAVASATSADMRRGPAQVCFTEHDHMVKTFPADRANESLKQST